MHKERPCSYCNQLVTNNSRQRHEENHLLLMQRFAAQAEVPNVGIAEEANVNIADEADVDNVEAEIQIVEVLPVEQEVARRVEMARRNGEIIEID